jgi:hypothetical protein
MMDDTMKPPVHLLATAFAAVIIIAACDRTPATTMSENESQAPRPVRLSSDVRKRWEGRFDVTAVEELLASMTPGDQHDFLVSIGATGTTPSGAETRDVTVLTRSTDPARQALIDRMWAPFWDHLPPELLDRTDLPYPGRELAKARRAARASAREQGNDQ